MKKLEIVAYQDGALTQLSGKNCGKNTRNGNEMFDEWEWIRIQLRRLQTFLAEPVEKEAIEATRGQIAWLIERLTEMQAEQGET